jgi:hypothetical protein
MSKKLLSRLLAGFLAAVTTAGSAVIAGADMPEVDFTKPYPILDGTTAARLAMLDPSTYTVNLYVNGATVNINPALGTSKVNSKSQQVTVSGRYLLGKTPYDGAYDVTASPDLKWYVGPVNAEKRSGNYYSSDAKISATSGLDGYGVDEYGTYVKYKNGNPTTRSAKGQYISVSKGKITLTATADDFKGGDVLQEIVKLFYYDSVNKTETLLDEILVLVRYASKEVVLYDNDDSKKGTKVAWAAKSVSIGEPYELNFGYDAAKTLDADPTDRYLVKCDVPGAISFAIDRTNSDGTGDEPDDGKLIPGDTGWYPSLTGVSESEAMKVWFRAQGLKDVVKAGLLAFNKKWITGATETYKYSDGAQNHGELLSTLKEPNNTWAKYEAAYDAQVQKLKDKATAANIVITNEQSGSTLKLKVNINNSATTDNDVYSDGADGVDPVSITIGKETTDGKTTEVIDFYAKGLIESDVEVINKDQITGVTDFSMGTTTITDKATVMVIADDEDFTNALELMNCSDGTAGIIKSKLMKPASGGLNNFALVTSTTDTTKYKKFTGATVTAKMAGNNAQLLLEVKPKTLTTQYATVIVAYGQKIANDDATDAKLYDNIVVVPLKIHNGEAGAPKLSKITIGRTTIPVDTDADADGIQTVAGEDGTYTTVKTTGALSGDLKFTTTPASVAPKAVTKILGKGTISTDGKNTITMARDVTLRFTVTMAGYDADGNLDDSEDVVYTFDFAGNADAEVEKSAAPTYTPNLNSDAASIAIGRDGFDGNDYKVVATGDGTLSYKWYLADDADGTGETQITKGDYSDGTLTLTAGELAEIVPAGGVKYLYAKVTNTSEGCIASDPVKSFAKKLTFTVTNASRPVIAAFFLSDYDEYHEVDRNLVYVLQVNTPADGGQLSYKVMKPTNVSSLNPDTDDEYTYAVVGTPSVADGVETVTITIDKSKLVSLLPAEPEPTSFYLYVAVTNTVADAIDTKTATANTDIPPVTLNPVAA